MTERERAVIGGDLFLDGELAGRGCAAFAGPRVDRGGVAAGLVAEDGADRLAPRALARLQRHAILRPRGARERRLDGPEIERDRVGEPQLLARVMPEEILLGVALDELH